MCGIVAVLLADKGQPASELIYNPLCMLQHRGQDAAGIVTADNGFLNLQIKRARREFSSRTTEADRQRRIGALPIPHCGVLHERGAQPFYTNTPCGVCLAHNGISPTLKSFVRR